MRHTTGVKHQVSKQTDSDWREKMRPLKIFYVALNHKFDMKMFQTFAWGYSPKLDPFELLSVSSKINNLLAGRGGEIHQRYDN